MLVQIYSGIDFIVGLCSDVKGNFVCTLSHCMQYFYTAVGEAIFSLMHVIYTPTYKRQSIHIVCTRKLKVHLLSVFI